MYIYKKKLSTITQSQDIGRTNKKNYNIPTYRPHQSIEQSAPFQLLTRNFIKSDKRRSFDAGLIMVLKERGALNLWAPISKAFSSDLAPVLAHQ